MVACLVTFFFFLIAQKVLVALVYQFLLALDVFKHVFGLWD
jgi:hypothetical protein